MSRAWINRVRMLNDGEKLREIFSKGRRINFMIYFFLSNIIVNISIKFKFSGGSVKKLQDTCI